MTPTFSEIQSITARYYRIDPDWMTAKRRGPDHIAHPRMIAMYLSRSMMSASLEAIGRAFNRDHTTVMNAVERVSTDDETFPGKDINAIRRRIKSAVEDARELERVHPLAFENYVGAV